MIYLDSSALLKLLVEEAESATLVDFLAGHADLRAVTSELAQVEVPRALRRLAPSALGEARTLLTQLDTVPLGQRILQVAAELEDPLLRTLDALHLASALDLGGALRVFVSYDYRLNAAARAAGLEVEHPGARPAP